MKRRAKGKSRGTHILVKLGVQGGVLKHVLVPADRIYTTINQWTDTNGKMQTSTYLHLMDGRNNEMEISWDECSRLGRMLS